MQLLKSLPPAAKKIISVAFFAGLVFLGARTCSVESASCELVFKLGAAMSEPNEQPTELEVRLYERKGTELLGSFRKYYQGGQGPDARWPLSLSSGRYRLEGELRSNRRVRSFAHEISIEDEEVISVYLDRHFKDSTTDVSGAR